MLHGSRKVERVRADIFEIDLTQLDLARACVCSLSFELVAVATACSLSLRVGACTSVLSGGPRARLRLDSCTAVSHSPSYSQHAARAHSDESQSFCVCMRGAPLAASMRTFFYTLQL